MQAHFFLPSLSANATLIQIPTPPTNSPSSIILPSFRKEPSNPSQTNASRSSFGSDSDPGPSKLCHRTQHRVAAPGQRRHLQSDSSSSLHWRVLEAVTHMYVKLNEKLLKWHIYNSFFEHSRNATQVTDEAVTPQRQRGSSEDSQPCYLPYLTYLSYRPDKSSQKRVDLTWTWKYTKKCLNAYV